MIIESNVFELFLLLDEFHHELLRQLRNGEGARNVTSGCVNNSIVKRFLDDLKLKSGPVQFFLK